MRSDIARRSGVYGGVYVWDFESHSHNVHDLHDGNTNIGTSKHHIDFTNESDTSKSYEWVTEFKLLGQQTDEIHIHRRATGGGSVGPGERIQTYKSHSVDVGPYRPDTIGLWGRTYLSVGGGEWEIEEETHPVYIN